MSFVRSRIQTTLRPMSVWVAAGLVAVAVWAGGVEPRSIEGLWRTAPSSAGRATIRLFEEGGVLVGELVELDQPTYPPGDPMAGQPRVDRENPDPALRKRPIQGLRLLEGFRFNGEVWVGGTIYDPDNGRTYKCTMRLDGDRLKVRGFVGFSLFGRTTEWSRAATPPPQTAPSHSGAPAPGS
jgi:uncharacterized protein (DUF2147 family)